MEAELRDQISKLEKQLKDSQDMVLKLLKQVERLEMVEQELLVGSVPTVELL